jgi:hydrogenase/urease accessory protein HupE
MRQLAILLFLACLHSGAQAHEMRPAYLDLRAIGADSYKVLWRVPALGDLRMRIDPRFPGDCTSTERSTRLEGTAFSERWILNCPGGLGGGQLSIDGLPATKTDVLVHIQRPDGAMQNARLTASAPTLSINDSASSFEVMRSYLGLGIEHILLGVDHLMFVLALLILVQGWRRLVATITAFTFAHSVALAAATFGLIKLPQAPVEAVIALSIVFVAVEIIRTRAGHESLASRQPWIVAFCFGLLHGLGFAGALREIGLPEQSISLALLFFNLGVEAGQLLFIAAVLGTLRALRGSILRVPAWAWRVPVYAIGAAASFWMIDRIAGFWA